MADKIRILSPEEAQEPCAKFYDMIAAEVFGEVLKAFEKPIDSSQAVMPENINEIFKPGNKAANGYCMLPCENHKDGAYAVVTTVFPKATTDMLYWWFPWRGLKSVNYTVSNSEHNHSVAMSAQHKKKAADPFIPDEAKCRGIIQSCVKYTGACEMEDFIVHFARPEEMEITSDHFADSKVGFVGGWYMREDRKCNDPYKKAIDEFAHVMIQNEEGVAVTTYIWCGYRGLKGKNMRMDSYGPVIDEAYAKQIGLSFAQDMAQLAAILPELYAMEK